MSNSHRSLPCALAIGAFLLTACGGAGGNGAGAATPVVQGSLPQTGDEAGIRNVAGQYSGTIDDNQNGKGTATASLAQFRSAVGGSFTYTYGTHSYVTSSSAQLEGDGLRGASVITIGSTVCSYAFAAKYDPVKFTLAGKYKAVHGCAGERGTISLTEQCYYLRDWAAVRPDGPGLKPC